MTKVRVWAWMPVGGLVAAALGLALVAAEPPKEEVARKPSTYAPAEDLESQVQVFLDRIKEDLQSESNYHEASVQRVVRDANTLAVLALVLGQHDEANRYQASAPVILQRALTLAHKAQDYAAAKAACTDLLTAANAPAPSNDLQWKCVGDIVELMHQIPKLNTNLRKQVRSEKVEKFEAARGESAGLAATIAAIAHVSLFDESYCSDQSDRTSWIELCGMMRDAAYDVNQAVRRGDQPGAIELLKPLQRTCDDCHAQFKD